MKPLLSTWIFTAAAFSQTLPNSTLPIPSLAPGATIFLEASAPTAPALSGKITTRLVKLDSTVQQSDAPDGSLLISAIPSTAPTPSTLFVNKVLWTPTFPASPQPPGQQMFCLVPPLTPNWTPVAVVEERVSTGGSPVNYQLFYLVSFPGQAQGAPTPEGLTWTRASAFCAGGGAVSYTPASLPTTDTRIHVYLMVTGQ